MSARTGSGVTVILVVVHITRIPYIANSPVSISLHTFSISFSMSGGGVIHKPKNLNLSSRVAYETLLPAIS